MAELKADVESKVQKDTDKFPCSSCGANMHFDPESGTLTCTYCGNKAAIANETTEIKEYDFSKAQETANENWGRENIVIKCDGCGAETVIGVKDAAQFCAFCGSSHIIKHDKSAGIVPESLIPFKVAEKNARQLFTDWVGKRFFAPRALKNNYQMERLKGVYIPCWTYDANTFSRYTGEGGTYYYVTEKRTVTENGKQVTKDVQVRKIRWWPTSGSYSEFFNDLPVFASAHLDQGLMEQLEPFDRNELVNYKSEYLSGFLAEKYSIGLEEGWQKARGVIDNEIYAGVVRQINADETRNINIHTAYNDIKYKLTMLPVWISAYKYKNKSYTFMVNGQTGRISGKAPVSVLKVLLACGIGVALIALAYYFFLR